MIITSVPLVAVVVTMPLDETLSMPAFVAVTALPVHVPAELTVWLPILPDVIGEDPLSVVQFIEVIVAEARVPPLANHSP